MYSRGISAELLLQSLLVGREIHVLQPVGGGLPYDVVVEKNGKFFKVQVKTTSSKSENKNQYVVKLVHGCNNKSTYTVDEVDVFAVHITEEDEWFFMPNTGILSMYLPKKEDSGNCCKYEKYRWNWGVFDG